VLRALGAGCPGVVYVYVGSSQKPLILSEVNTLSMH